LSIVEEISKITADIKNYKTVAEVKLLAVSKYASDEQIIEAHKAGLRDFAENYVMPALDRQHRLNSLGLENLNWHFIGRIQSNKVNKLVGNFETIQSVDRLDILQKIDHRAESLNCIQNVFLQVNVSDEETKGGFKVAIFDEIINKLNDFKSINVKGLMTICQKSAINSRQSPEDGFKMLVRLCEKLQNSLSIENCELSMGMSNDYIPAIKNGSTMIRIGRRLFE
jgi:pyridoxal phosphate enzyme (YggS family)